MAKRHAGGSGAGSAFSSGKRNGPEQSAPAHHVMVYFRIPTSLK